MSAQVLRLGAIFPARAFPNNLTFGACVLRRKIEKGRKKMIGLSFDLHVSWFVTSVSGDCGSCCGFVGMA